MTTLFKYPGSAAFGHVLPKSKIYEQGSPTRATKELFVRQVEKIRWEYKLAPETINLKGTSDVPEIQVFSITLKEGDLKAEVLRCIDQAIPFPIFFELRYDGKVKPVCAYKRPREGDSMQWVTSEYFDTGWMPTDTTRTPLPIAFDLETLYGHLLSPLLPYPARSDESLHARVERMESIRIKQRELACCSVRLRKEKQFNRKIAINAELRELKQKLENLTRPYSSSGTVVIP